MEKRKPWYIDFEISVSLDKIEKNYQLLQSKFTDAVTAQKKKAMWEAIAAKANASRATYTKVNK